MLKVSILSGGRNGLCALRPEMQGGARELLLGSPRLIRHLTYQEIPVHPSVPAAWPGCGPHLDRCAGPSCRPGWFCSERCLQQDSPAADSIPFSKAAPVIFPPSAYYLICQAQWQKQGLLGKESLSDHFC